MSFAIVSGATYQVAHEAFQIIDESAFVVRHRSCFGLLQFDAAGDACHEGLRVLGQAFEYPN